MANHLRQAVDDCLRDYDQYADKLGAAGFLWADLTSSLHLLGDHDTELGYARTGREKNPDNRGAFSYEIRALAALDRLEEIRELMDLAESRDLEVGWDFPRVVSTADRDLRSHGHFALADELSSRAVQWSERRGERTAAYGQALYHLGRLEDARAVFEELLEVRPENVSLLGWLGSAAAGLGDREVAADISELLAELENRPYQRGGPTWRRVWIAAELGNLDEAVELVDEAYRRGSPYRVSFRHLMQLRALQGYGPFERLMEPKE